MSLKRSCSTWVAVYVLAAAAIGAIVYRRFPLLGAAVGGGVVGGGIVWLGLAYLAGVRTKIAEIIRLRSAGGLPADGGTISVTGTVEAEGATLTSPIGGVPCVAYKYEVRNGEDLLYDGFALAPAGIVTPYGPLRILAYPELQIAPRDALTADALPQFRDYIARTKFHEPSLGDIRTLFAELGDTSGRIRRDNRMTQDDGALQHARFVEWTLLPGQRVFVTGHYSAQQGGLVPDPGTPFSLIIRDANDGGSVARSVRGAVGNLIGAAIFLAVAAAALIGLFAFVPLAASEQMSPSLTPTWREIRLERFLERRVRGRLRDAGLLDSGIATAILPEGSARGRVALAGRDVAVSRASATRLGDLTVIRIDDDLVVLTVEHGRPIRLRFGNDDVDPRTFADDLEADVSGGWGRFTYFRDDAREPACRVSFRASPENAK